MLISPKRTPFEIVERITDVLGGLILTAIVAGFLGFWLIGVYYAI